MTTANAAAEIAMDRFVSASSGQDAVVSLQSLLEGFGETSDEKQWQASWVWQHEELAESLVNLLQHNELKANRISLNEEDGAAAVTLVLQLYQQHLAKDVQSLLQPSASSLLEALLDVMDRSTSNSSSTYTRVLALQVLQQVSIQHSHLANQQWLQAPNGLHRLADVLTTTTTTTTTATTTQDQNHNQNPMEEAVRTQALQVALQLARTSPPMAKVMLFAEVESKLLEMTWKLYGGLTKGNPMVQDVLELILTLLEQAADPSLHELLWQRPAVPRRLAQLVDLRGGDQFLNPQDYLDKKQTIIMDDAAPKFNPKSPSSSSSSSSSSSRKSKPKLGPLSSRSMDDDDEDDLDALLTTGRTQIKTSKSANTNGDTTSQIQSHEYPRLLESEEKVVSTVLKIVNVLLEENDLRRKVWSEYAPGLCSLIWELALQSPPPMTNGLPAAVFLAFPSSALQQQALELVATKLTDPITMDRHNGLDRLLEKVCTGGSGSGLVVGKDPSSLGRKLGISQAALAVLRSILDSERIHTILLHTLAPPPMIEEEEEEQEQRPIPGPTVVQKLWNTVAGNLTVPNSSSGSSSNDTLPEAEATSSTISKDQRTLFLSGALGGLAVFLIDEESREMLFRATPTAANLDHMLEVLVESSTNSTTHQHSDDIDIDVSSDNLVVCSLYRFLCEYIYQTPRIVQTLLSNPASTHLATLATTKSTNNNNKTKPLVYLLLGLCMEFFPTEATECGGWTRTSILELLQTIGISKVTKELEGFKKTKNVKLPWDGCDLEAKHWSHWYQQAVWVVRKRIVREMAGSSSWEDDDDADVDIEGTHPAVNGEEPTSPPSANSNAKIKPLQRLISQQTTELEELRLQLEQANTKIASQDHQLSTLQRRLKSAPTELDGMLNELTTKTASLEEQISTLQNQNKHAQEQHQEQVAAMTQKLDEQREEATTLRASENEAKEDRDRMKEELQALSQAYSSLEDEYRRSSLSSTAAGSATGETTSSHHQAQGEASTSGGSTELSTLRAENARLRQDARTADEWMTMAVQKINEMGAHAAQLEQVNAALKNEALQTASMSQNESLRQEIDQLQHQLGSLQEQVRQEQTRVASLRESLQLAEAQKAAEIEAAIATATKEHVSKSVSIDPNQIAEMERLQTELETRSYEIQDLQTALEQARTASSTASSIPPASPALATNEEVAKQLEKLRHETEEYRCHTELEMYKKESTIRELEDRLGSGLGPYTVDNIRERDKEIEELRAANEAAQEWMSKAVEHHQLLQEKVAALAEEKAALVAQQGQIILPTAHDNDVKILEERANELESQKTALEEKIASMEATIASHEHSTKEARDEVQTLTRSLEETTTEFSEYRIESEAKVGNWTERVLALENQLSERELELQELQKDLNDALTRTAEFESWTDLAQSKIAQLLSDKEQSDKDLQTKEEEIATLKNKEVALQADLEACRNVMEQIRCETKEALVAKEQLEVELEALRLQLDSNGAQEPADTTPTVVSGFDAAPKDAIDFFGGISDKKVTSSTTQITPVDKKYIDHAEEIARLKEELRVANETIESDQDIVCQWEDKVAELETTIQSLAAQMDEEQNEANRVISQWQESYDAADEKCKELEGMLEEKNRTADATSLPDQVADHVEEILRLREELKVANQTIESEKDVVRELGDRVAELNATISALTAQIEEEQEESKRVISQWQGSCDAGDEKCRELERKLEEQNQTREAVVGPGIENLLQAKEDELRIAKEALTQAENVIKEWDERSKDLDRESGAKLIAAEHHDHDRSSTRSNFEERAMQLEYEKTALEASLADARNALSEFRNESVLVVDQWTERVVELANSNAELEAQLEQQAADANEAIIEWKTKFEELENDVRVAKEEANPCKNRAEKSDGDVSSRHMSDEDQGQLQKKLELLENRLFQVDEECNISRQEKIDAERQVQDLSSKISILQERASQLEDEKVAIEAGLSERMKTDETQQVEDELAVERGRHNEAREEIQTLARSLDETRAELSDFRNESEAVVGQWTARVNELESEVSELAAQLAEQEADANDAISRWKISAEELENELQVAEDALEQWKERAEELEDGVRSTEARCRQLEEESNICRQEKVEAERQAQDLSSKISILQERANQLEDEKVAIEARMSERTKSDETQQVEEELAVERGRHNEAREEIQTLTRSLEETRAELSDFRNESEAVVGQWTARVNELESEVSELATQLAEQEADANDAISRWKIRAEELENELQVAEDALEQWKERAEELEDGVRSTEARCRQLEEESNICRQEKVEAERHAKDLSSKISILQEKARELEDDKVAIEARISDRMTSDEVHQVEEELAVERGRHNEAREEIQTLARSLDEANEAVSRWEVKVEEMETEVRTVKEMLADAKDDVRHANEGLKDANNRLVEAEEAVARWQQRTEQLEDEVRSLRSQIEESEDDVRHWKERSQELESEVSSLSAQIEDGRGVGLQEKSDQQLRKSLLRAVEEVEVARAAEKEANERLAKLRLHTAIGEQEIIAAKSEINFVTEAMDELRMNEESKRASLEYRIGSLEDENDVLRRCHSSELETIRNELSQGSMERDRILHQLKECEKTNSALVFAASTADTQGMDHPENVDAEISKLRIENAYLLTVAADDKARAERRLREAMAAHRATVETDTILEHELRLAAESTVQSLKAQLDEYRNSQVR